MLTSSFFYLICSFKVAGRNGFWDSLSHLSQRAITDTQVASLSLFSHSLHNHVHLTVSKNDEHKVPATADISAFMPVEALVSLEMRQPSYKSRLTQRPYFFTNWTLHTRHVRVRFKLRNKSFLSLHTPWSHDHKGGCLAVVIFDACFFVKTEKRSLMVEGGSESGSIIVMAAYLASLVSLSISAPLNLTNPINCLILFMKMSMHSPTHLTMVSFLYAVNASSVIVSFSWASIFSASLWLISSISMYRASTSLSRYNGSKLATSSTFWSLTTKLTFFSHTTISSSPENGFIISLLMWTFAIIAKIACRNKSPMLAGSPMYLQGCRKKGISGLSFSTVPVGNHRHTSCVSLNFFSRSPHNHICPNVSKNGDHKVPATAEVSAFMPVQTV